MISDFVDQSLSSLSYELLDVLNVLEGTFTRDYSKFTYVDGEEGDYGDILCYQGKELVYTHKIYGGDCEEIVLTEFGKNLVKPIVLDTISKHLFN